MLADTISESSVLIDLHNEKNIFFLNQHTLAPKQRMARRGSARSLVADGLVRAV